MEGGAQHSQDDRLGILHACFGSKFAAEPWLRANWQKHKQKCQLRPNKIPTLASVYLGGGSINQYLQEPTDGWRGSTQNVIGLASCILVLVLNLCTNLVYSQPDSSPSQNV